MLILDTTTALVQVITGSAGAIDTEVSYVDYTSPSTFAVAGQNQLITTAATTTICASPTGSIIRNVKVMNIRNSSATVANAVEVKHTDGTTSVSLFKCTLQPLETLVMNDAGTWFVYDNNGAVKTATIVNNSPLNNFSTAAQTPTAASLTQLTGSSIAVPVGKLRIGTMFYWIFDITKTAAGLASSAYHIRIGTANTSADAAVITFTKPAGTAVADTGQITINATVRGPLGASCILEATFNLVHNLQITGHYTLPTFQSFVTSSGFDSTVASLFVSLSCTTGASDAITTQCMQAFAYNL